MFAHFETKEKISIEEIIYKMNSFLPDDIFIRNMFLVSDQIHARFSAIRRTYKYYISNSKDPFNKECYVYYRDLDVTLMNRASKYLLNKQDFSSFSKLHTQTNNNYCNVFEAEWERIDNYIIFTICSDRFLRNMVRAIVGTLILVGERRLSPKKIKDIISAKDR